MTSYSPHAVWHNNTASSGLQLKRQSKYKQISSFFLNVNYQRPSVVNTCNSQMNFRCTYKLNNIPETNKISQCLSKYGEAFHKLICFEFPTPVTIKARPGLVTHWYTLMYGKGEDVASTSSQQWWETKPIHIISYILLFRSASL